MPTYVPRAEPVRKKEILAKREQELRHAIKHGVTGAKLHKAAEAVRSAQLKVFKGIIEQFRYENARDGTARGTKALRDQHRWQELHVDEIVSMYTQEHA